MTKAIKKALCLALCLMMVVSVTIASATEETGIMPRLTGIDSQATRLSIGDLGRASCWCLVLADGGYSVDVTMSLEKDGVSIKTWTGSGASVDLEKTYYVTEGHDYQLIITSRVKTSGGLYLLTYTMESQIVHY